MRYLISRYPSTNFAKHSIANRFGDGAICCADTPRVWPHRGMRLPAPLDSEASNGVNRTRFAQDYHSEFLSPTNKKHGKIGAGFIICSYSRYAAACARRQIITNPQGMLRVDPARPWAASTRSITSSAFAAGVASPCVSEFIILA